MKRKRSMVQDTPIEFDPDGDLTLIVGSNPCRDMKVDSNALCRSSPVFHRMLRSSYYIEAKPDQGEWRVKLPEDSIEAFTILMDLIHCRHECTPHQPSLKHLHQILVITNKYDMARVLRSVARQWIGPFVRRAKRYSVENLQTLLFVAWELGHPTLFSTIATRLATECRADATGYLVDSEGVRLLANQPQLNACDVHESLKKTRQDQISIIRRQCHALAKMMENRPVAQNVIAASDMNLFAHMFSPSGPDPFSTLTITALLDNLDRIYTRSSRAHFGHGQCSPFGKILASINRHIQSLPRPEGLHLDFLKEQSAKSKVVLRRRRIG